MRSRAFFGAATLALAGCVQADTGDEGLAPRRDASVDSTAKPDTGTGKDTGTASDSTIDSGTKDTSVTTDSGVDPDTGFDPDTGSDPDTGFDPDTGSVFDTGTPGGACLYCSSGTCALPLEDYSCLLNCLLDGWLDCTYTTGSAKPCLCHD